MQSEIWMGTVEINVAASESPNAVKRAVTVVTTWASSYDEFARKSRQMVESHGWKLLSVERACPVPDDQIFTNEVEDMLERIRENREATIFGTFHSHLR
jgi:hypothetical protein